MLDKFIYRAEEIEIDIDAIRIHYRRAFRHQAGQARAQHDELNEHYRFFALVILHVQQHKLLEDILCEQFHPVRGFSSYYLAGVSTFNRFAKQANGLFFCKEQSDKQLHSSVQADLEAGWSKTRKYTERLWKISVTLFVTVASWQTGITDPFSKHLSDKMP